jgi:hypothetical protein
MLRRSFVVSFAMLAVVAMAVLDKASAQEALPFKGTLEGTFTATPIDPADPLHLLAHLIADGQSTQLGAFSYDFPHTVDRSVRPSKGEGKSVFTAANGDEVFADIEGEATLIVVGLLHGVEVGTIKGGTGRFKNASGSFVIERLIDQGSFTTVGSFSGTIILPRDEKH